MTGWLQQTIAELLTDGQPHSVRALSDALNTRYVVDDTVLRVVLRRMDARGFVVRAAYGVYELTSAGRAALSKAGKS